jgi:hypothetical protein
MISRVEPTAGEANHLLNEHAVDQRPEPFDTPSVE